MKLDHHNCSFLPGFTDAVALNKNLGVFMESVDLYNKWAVNSFSPGMEDRVITSLRYSRQLDPEYPGSYCNLGITFSSRGILKEVQHEKNAAMRRRNKVLQGKQARV